MYCRLLTCSTYIAMLKLLRIACLFLRLSPISVVVAVVVIVVVVAVVVVVVVVVVVLLLSSSH